VDFGGDKGGRTLPGQRASIACESFASDGALVLKLSMAVGTAELRFSRKAPEHQEALARVREWTRERFSLAADDAILVSEVACRVPGCPPVETVVAFWIGETRHHCKFFKPVRDVVLEDLPPAWLRNALAVPDGFQCDCC
jgi:hypothetical protein